MHPSTTGSGVSGASKSQHNTSSAPGTSGPNGFAQGRSVNIGTLLPINHHIGQREIASHLHPAAEGSSQTSGLWYYPPADTSAKNSSTPAAPMISPSSTFYNPNDAALHEQTSRDHQSRQYQQWLDANYGQQQSTSFHSTYQATNLVSGSQQDLQGNPYSSLLQGHFAAPHSMSQYGGSTSATITQSTMGGIDGMSNATTYHDPAGDMYSTYFPDLLSINGSPASTPEHGSAYPASNADSTRNSYTNSPDPLYQQQQQQQPQQQQQQQHREIERFAQQANHRGPTHPARQPPRKANNIPRQQAPIQYNPPDAVAQPPQSTNLPTSQPTSLSPHPKAWINGGYQSKNSNAVAVPTTHRFMPPNTTGPAGPSQPKPAQTGPIKRPVVNTAPAPTHAGAKRKKIRKNDSPEPPYGGEEGATDSDSDDYDESGLGMSGRIDIGLSGLGVVGRGKRERGSRL